MSGFTGINVFGNLTLQNGQRLKFSDIKDVNGDGKIDKDEFEAFLKENNVDKIDLSLVDKNGDGEITEQEYAILEQKQNMQSLFGPESDIYQTISIDFAGRDDLIKLVTEKLTAAVAVYDNNYNGDISKMAEAFKRDLPELYTNIKAEVLKNDPTATQTKVVSSVVDNLITEGLPQGVIDTLSNQLTAEAKVFAQAYTGANLEADLKTHLQEWLNKSDADNMTADITKYQSRVGAYGSNIESGELAGLKLSAQYLIETALDKGVPVSLGGKPIADKGAIKAVLQGYTDGNKLKADIQSFIDGLSTVSKKEQVLADETAKQDASAEKALANIPASAYAVNPNLIDYSGIKGYADNKTYSKKGKGADYYKDEARNVIEGLKDQFINQIKSMLEAKGIPFEKIETIFENVFAKTKQDTVDECITGRHGTWFRKSKSEYNVKTLVDTFVEKFNQNISTAIDEYNNANKAGSIATADIDYSVCTSATYLDEEGNEVEDGVVFDNDVKAALENGGTVKTKGKGADYYVQQAEGLINRLKSQMLAKAKSLCAAKGVAFDTNNFNTMFNNAKLYAVTQSVTGRDGKTAWSANGKGWGLGALTVAGGAAGALVYGIALLFGGRKSQSTFNPQECISIFMSEFTNKYTEYVDGEKAKGTNK